jgi:hypothetical protein
MILFHLYNILNNNKKFFKFWYLKKNKKMKRPSLNKEEIKIQVQNNIGIKKDEAFQKHKDLKQEINTIIRNINMKLDFKNITKEKLQPLEIVN